MRPIQDQLRQLNATDGEPVFSPDGTQIVFDRYSTIAPHPVPLLKTTTALATLLPITVRWKQGFSAMYDGRRMPLGGKRGIFGWVDSSFMSSPRFAEKLGIKRQPSGLKSFSADFRSGCGEILPAPGIEGGWGR